MTESGVAPIARPAEPIEYGTRSSPRAGPPLIIPIIAVVSLAIAVLTIALCAWFATRAYFTAPSPRRMGTPPSHGLEIDETLLLSRRRVTLEEGNALLDGIAKVVPLSAEQRKMLTRVLLSAEDRVAVDLGADPTPEKIAAAAVKSGKLFGENGSYIEFPRVRVEVSDKRARITGEPGDQPMIEYQQNGSSTTSGGYPQVWSFRPPRPPPTPSTPPAPPPPPTLREQLNDLAPRLPFYADAIVSTLLAVLLLVAAVSLLHYRRRGRTLHFVWAWVKLPLALGAAAAYFWLIMGGKVELPRGVTPWTQFILGNAGFVTSLLAALYAALVLVLLSLPHVRRYFRDVHSPARSQ